MSLPALPVPVEDETLISQLVRVADANGLRSVEALHRRIEHDRPSFEDLIHGPSETWLEAAAERTGIDRTRLFSGTRLGGRYRSIRRWQPPIEKRISVYCPACLAHDGAWRLSWLLPYARACPLHEVLLADHRSDCAKPSDLRERWSNTRNTTQPCDARVCTAPLTSRAADPAPSAVLRDHNRFLEIDAEFRLRVLGPKPVELPTGRHAPRVLDVLRIHPCVRLEATARLQLLDRPDWGIVHRADQR